MATGYREIKADLLRRITGGDLPPGSLLPPELDLCETYGAARATVGRALAELVEDGLIERRRKSGTRVREAPLRQIRMEIPRIRAEIEARGAEYGYGLIRSAFELPPPAVGARMGIAAGRKARHVLCLHLADRIPYQLEDRWINAVAVPEAFKADFSAIGPNEWLVRQVPFTEVEQAMQAVRAGPDLAGPLDCAEGEALFQVERQTFRGAQTVTLVWLTWRPGHRVVTRY